MCMSVLLVCMYVRNMCLLVSSLRFEVTDSCEPLWLLGIEPVYSARTTGALIC